jgi:hypothetical protein
MDNLYHKIFNEQPDILYEKSENKAKHIQEKQSLKKQLSFLRSTETQCGIKYICHMNTTGYSVAARGYIAALFCAGFNVTVETVNNQVPPLDENLNNQITYLCFGRKIDYDKVIIHTVPDSFEHYANREEGKRIYGLTVWETDDIPKPWIRMFDHIDEVIVPCEWNKKCFEKAIRKPIHVVHHVVTSRIAKPLDFAKGKMVFYFIGEWCKRKGIDLLIRAFREVFDQYDDVILFVKTFMFPNVLEEKEAEQLFDKYRSKNVIINSQKVDDDYIASLHETGDVYVSFAKGEGVGLGAAEAAIRGNIVIAANYGGHSDYLKGCYLAKYKEVKCDPCECFHKKCTKGKKCGHYIWYDGSHQNWCEPDYHDMKRLMWKAYASGARNKYNPMSLKFTQSEIGKQFSKILI